MSARIFLIDQSAEKIGGHYIEYLLRVKEAIDQEFEVHLVGNKKVSKKSHGLGFIPGYKFSYFGMPFENFIRAFLRFHNAIRIYKSKITKERISGIIKSYILLSRVSYPKKELKKYSFFTRLIPVRLQLFFVTILVLIVGFPLLILGTVIFLILNKVRKFLKQYIHLILRPSSISNLIKNLSQNQILYLKKKQFGKDSLQLIKKFEITNSDILFFSTIGLHEIHGLFAALRKCKSKPKVVVILRREIEENFASNSDWQYLGSLAKDFNIKFYSDTKSLAKSYSLALATNVGEFPIPYGTLFMDYKSTAQRDFSISYLGDAREEKKFTEFAELAEVLHNSGIKVFCQLNQVGKGNFEIGIAVNRLLQILPKNQIALIPMNSDDYLKILRNSNIIFLDYLPTNYVNRSSGIFTEALASQVEIITSDGTWMHRELDRMNNEYFRSFTYDKTRVLLDKNLPFKFRGIYRFQGLPFREYKINFHLNTGLTLKATGWSDEHGICYIPTPILSSSEEIISASLFNLYPQTKLELAEVPVSRRTRLIGSITNGQNRSFLSYTELIQSNLCYKDRVKLSKQFLQFHSENSILREFKELSCK